MKKRLLSILLVFSLLLALCPAALAAEVRETDFFTPQSHADVDFADMEYRHIEPDGLLEEIGEVRALLGRAANEKAVISHTASLTEQFLEILTMQKLATIRAYQDVTDETAAEELRHTTELYVTASDELMGLLRDTLNSPCGGFLTGQLSQGEIDACLDYEGMSDEQISQSSQEALLENEYLQAAYQTYTAEYKGGEWDEDSARAALAVGKLDQEDYAAVTRAIAKAQNEALGDIYLRMVELRQEIARSYGYDSYMDYAYTEIYQRDYTPEEIGVFRDAVKVYLAPAADALRVLYYAQSANAVYTWDYSGDIALDMMEPYIGQMSSELDQAFQYMRAHGLYDTEKSDVKASGGFTTELDGYGAPFFFNCPAGTLYDFTTAVHEFGHYNNYYWQPSGLYGGKSVDLAEVHSQGLELLFAHYYPEIFGGDAQAVLDYQMLNLTSAIVQGALQDELQQFVYTAEDLTLSDINREYRRLCGEYGLVDEDNPNEELYSWVQIPHTFTSPCYYISYAVSAAGAFSFWLDAQEDYFHAVDSYLEFTALPAGLGFQTSFALLLLDDPLDPDYLEELAGALWEELELEERLEETVIDIPFTDVYEDSWYFPYVTALASAGLIQGDGDGAFHPTEYATRDMAYQVLTGENAPSDGDAPITRLEFSRLLAEHLELSSDKPSPFTDVDDPAVTALAGLCVVTGYAGGTFRPDGSLTRAELCALLYRAALAAASSRLAAMIVGR